MLFNVTLGRQFLRSTTDVEIYVSVYHKWSEALCGKAKLQVTVINDNITVMIVKMSLK